MYYCCHHSSSSTIRTRYVSTTAINSSCLTYRSHLYPSQTSSSLASSPGPWARFMPQDARQWCILMQVVSFESFFFCFSTFFNFLLKKKKKKEKCGGTSTRVPAKGMAFPIYSRFSNRFWGGPLFGLCLAAAAAQLLCPGAGRAPGNGKQVGKSRTHGHNTVRIEPATAVDQTCVAFQFRRGDPCKREALLIQSIRIHISTC